MDTKAETLTILTHARDTMRQALVHADKQQQIYPDWTIKEILAHIIGWDEALTISLQRFMGQVELTIAAVRGVDHYNAESVATRMALNLEQIKAEWEAARAELATVIEALPEEKFAENLLAPWGGQVPIQDLIRSIATHEEGHATDILKSAGEVDEEHFHKH